MLGLQRLGQKMPLLKMLQQMILVSSMLGLRMLQLKTQGMKKQEQKMRERRMLGLQRQEHLMPGLQRLVAQKQLPLKLADQMRMLQILLRFHNQFLF